MTDDALKYTIIKTMSITRGRQGSLLEPLINQYKTQFRLLVF